MTTTALLRIALVALVTVVPACAAARQDVAPAAMDSTACAAIAAAIDSLVIGSQATRVGLIDRTTPRSDVTLPEPLTTLMPEVDGSTLRSFRENNAQSVPACATLPLVGGMTHITPRELDALPKDEHYWEVFHARFPGVSGVTSTSGVGIGKDGRQALLTVDHSCGGICGAGHVVLLERDDDGKWRVKRARMTWVS